jgi:Pacifastin inhibitor (LCMII)
MRSSVMGRSKGMRRTVPAAILLFGLGMAGPGMVHCGATTSPVGAMNEGGNANACSPVGSMAKASDGCNACTCSPSAQWACTTVACATPDGGGDSAGGPGGVSCDYNGVNYRPGDNFASADGCNSCTCSQTGQVACTLVACADAGPDAASSDGGCIGSPPANGCNFCLCTAGNWICGVTQCAPGDASRSDGPPTSGDASRNDAQPPSSDASASDGPPIPKDASTDAPAGVVCGSVTCGPGEWCDTSGANPTCRCGPVNGSCSAGLECCANLLSGCGRAHCNESCAAKNDAGPALTCP